MSFYNFLFSYHMWFHKKLEKVRINPLNYCSRLNYPLELKN